MAVPQLTALVGVGWDSPGSWLRCAPVTRRSAAQGPNGRLQCSREGPAYVADVLWPLTAGIVSPLEPVLDAAERRATSPNCHTSLPLLHPLTLLLPLTLLHLLALLHPSP